ncbi:polymerase II polypeptide D [Aureobasidium pullulans]|uniref:Polymerase II polypeptide D n=1 Tax=Aureobasidium pullulans TaxID=5580 RepID=A0A4S8SQR1_AURPU|nr:polymerase II polypeptide D [Aureobasidium pullulans]
MQVMLMRDASRLNSKSSFTLEPWSPEHQRQGQARVRHQQLTTASNLSRKPLSPVILSLRSIALCNRSHLPARLAPHNMANPGGPAPAPHMISRPKRAPTGDEEATAILRLGEFQQVPALNLSEARTIINAVTTRRRNIKQKVSESETLLKTQEYLELFARFKQQEHVTAVEQLLTTRTELERFERSQLGSLCPDTAEEAKTLVPSLEGKISDDDLQELLDEMMKLRNFVQ